MIGGKLKKLAQQHGLKVASGVAYGAMLGYNVTFSENRGYYKCLVISTLFPDPTQKSQFESYLKQQNLFKTYRIQSLSFGEKFIRIEFREVAGVMKKLQAFIDWFFPLLPQYGATGAEICTSCGLPITDGGAWKLLDNSAHHLHSACAQQLQQSVADANTQRKEADNGSYLWGLLGALLGAAVGAILWAVVLELGYYAAIVGFVIGFLANWGYKLLHGKQGKAKVAILILAIIFGVILGSFLADVYEVVTLINDGTLAGFAYGDIPSLILYMLQIDTEYRAAVITRILIGLVFAALGVYSLLRQAGKEVSDKKVVDLP